MNHFKYIPSLVFLLSFSVVSFSQDVHFGYPLRGGIKSEDIAIIDEVPWDANGQIDTLNNDYVRTLKNYLLSLSEDFSFTLIIYHWQGTKNELNLALSKMKCIRLNEIFNQDTIFKSKVEYKIEEMAIQSTETIELGQKNIHKKLSHKLKNRVEILFNKKRQ